MNAENRYHELMAKADEYANKATSEMHLARGSERPGIYAQLATMWIARARHEHDRLVAALLNQKLGIFKRRLVANTTRLDSAEDRLDRIERRLLLPAIDDPPHPRDYDPDDDDDFDLDDDEDDAPFYFVPLADGGAILVPESDN